jgi:hypothetical protein
MTLQPEDSSGPKIRRLTADEVAIHSGIANEDGLVVLPIRQLDDGRGVYPEASIFMVKELRASGIPIDFADESGNRTFETKKGWVLDSMNELIIGVAGGAGWDGLKRLSGRLRGEGGSTPVRITVIESRSGEAWVIEASQSDLPEAVEQLRREKDPDGGE